MNRPQILKGLAQTVAFVGIVTGVDSLPVVDEAIQTDRFAQSTAQLNEQITSMTSELQGCMQLIDGNFICLSTVAIHNDKIEELAQTKRFINYNDLEEFTNRLLNIESKPLDDNSVASVPRSHYPMVGYQERFRTLFPIVEFPHFFNIRSKNKDNNSHKNNGNSHVVTDFLTLVGERQIIRSEYIKTTEKNISLLEKEVQLKLQSSVTPYEALSNAELKMPTKLGLTGAAMALFKKWVVETKPVVPFTGKRIISNIVLVVPLCLLSMCMTQFAGLTLRQININGAFHGNAVKATTGIEQKTADGTQLQQQQQQTEKISTFLESPLSTEITTDSSVLTRLLDTLHAGDVPSLDVVLSVSELLNFNSTGKDGIFNSSFGKLQVPSFQSEKQFMTYINILGTEVLFRSLLLRSLLMYTHPVFAHTMTAMCAVASSDIFGYSTASNYNLNVSQTLTLETLNSLIAQFLYVTTRTIIVPIMYQIACEKVSQIIEFSTLNNADWMKEKMPFSNDYLKSLAGMMKAQYTRELNQLTAIRSIIMQKQGITTTAKPKVMKGAYPHLLDQCTGEVTPEIKQMAAEIMDVFSTDFHSTDKSTQKLFNEDIIDFLVALDYAVHKLHKQDNSNFHPNKKSSAPTEPSVMLYNYVGWLSPERLRLFFTLSPDVMESGSGSDIVRNFFGLPHTAAAAAAAASADKRNNQRQSKTALSAASATTDGSDKDGNSSSTDNHNNGSSGNNCSGIINNHNDPNPTVDESLIHLLRYGTRVHFLRGINGTEKHSGFTLSELESVLVLILGDLSKPQMCVDSELKLSFKPVLSLPLSPQQMEAIMSTFRNWETENIELFLDFLQELYEADLIVQNQLIAQMKPHVDRKFDQSMCGRRATPSEFQFKRNVMSDLMSTLKYRWTIGYLAERGLTLRRLDNLYGKFCLKDESVKALKEEWFDYFKGENHLRKLDDLLNKDSSGKAYIRLYDEAVARQQQAEAEEEMRRRRGGGGGGGDSQN